MRLDQLLTSNIHDNYNLRNKITDFLQSFLFLFSYMEENLHHLLLPPDLGPNLLKCIVSDIGASTDEVMKLLT